MLIFLDESGNMGRDITTNAGSNWFTISILICHSVDASRLIKKAVKNTLRRKINHKTTKRNRRYELKGSATTIATKKYFYQQICENKDWNIYSIVSDYCWYSSY